MTEPAPRTRQDLLDRIDASWLRLRALVDKATPDRWGTATDDGRRVKEALAGVAFWNETCVPVFAWLRDEPELGASRWYGGTDLGVAPGAPWPKDEVHHAREAAWARAASNADVLARLDAAHAAALSAVASVTPEDFRVGTGTDDTAGIPDGHPWERLSRGERLLAKATGCTYELYDQLAQQLERIIATP